MGCFVVSVTFSSTLHSEELMPQPQLAPLSVLSTPKDEPKRDSTVFQAFGIGMYVASAGDVISTEWALSKPSFYETNPLMANRAVRLSTHAIIPAAAWWFTKRLRRDGHGRAALFLRIGITAGYSCFTIYNLNATSR